MLKKLSILIFDHISLMVVSKLAYMLLSSRARGLDFGLSLNLVPYFVYMVQTASFQVRLSLHYWPVG